MHFAGGDHRRHAAVQIRFDPAELILTRRPVAEYRMHMRVDQARCYRRALAIDGSTRAFQVAVRFLADRDDQAVIDHERIGVENRLIDVAG